MKYAFEVAKAVEACDGMTPAHAAHRLLKLLHDQGIEHHLILELGHGSSLLRIISDAATQEVWELGPKDIPMSSEMFSRCAITEIESRMTIAEMFGIVEPAPC